MISRSFLFHSASMYMQYIFAEHLTRMQTLSVQSYNQYKYLTDDTTTVTIHLIMAHKLIHLSVWSGCYG